MDFKEIQDLLKLVNKTTLTEVEIEQKDFRLKIRRKAPDNKVVYQTSQEPATIVQPMITAAPTPVAQPEAKPAPEKPAAPEAQKEEASSDLIEFRSPMIGTFYRSSSPDTDAFVKVGDSVEKGQVLCIVEAMKLFNEIESEFSGKIVKIMLEDAQPVEYDQVLFLIDPNG
ncbi:MAG: acetyl-CoA carboxylase biotin carboxyl carrier protein [Bacteroidia bacterium]|nr:acetyl-CoA carboxylase biotin carboxyl carrier protein [Bacteroidia bacterium]